MPFSLSRFWGSRSRKTDSKRSPRRRRRSIKPLGFIEPLEERRLLTINVFANFDAIPQTDLRPPDPIHAVGPDNMIAMVNSQIGMFDRDGTEIELANLEGPLGENSGFFDPVSDDLGAFDPWITYDPYSQRFFAIAPEVEFGTVNADGTGGEIRGGFGADEANLLMAVSTTAGPNDLDVAPDDVDMDWHLFSFDGVHDFGGGDAWIDFPKVTADADSVYVSANYFTFGARAGAGALITRFDKAPLLDGLATTTVEIEAPAGVSSLQPAESVARDGGEPQLFITPHPAGQGLTIWELDDANVLSSFPTVMNAFLPFGAGIPQMDTADTLETLSPRMLSAVWRDGSIWTAHTVDDGGEAAVRWYELAENMFGFFDLAQTGDIDPGPDLYTFMPHINVDASGNMGITYTQSGPDQFANMMITGRRAGDAPGTTEPGIVARAGESAYTPNEDSATERWGDYAGLEVDPTTDHHFWAFGEFPVSADDWGTHVAGFVFPLPEDQFEPNNTIETATVLGSLPKITLRDLSIHDETDVDYFKVTAQDTGKLIFNAFFDEGLGDLDISVFDMDGNLIASGDVTPDGERIIIPVVTQEMYFLEIVGVDDAINVYDLEIENFMAPVPIDISLDPADDTGMSNFDNITSNPNARVFITADLAGFVDTFGDGSPEIAVLDQAGVDNMDPGVAVQVFASGQVLGTADVIAGTNNTFFEFMLPGIPPLVEGLNFLTAAVKVIDGQDPAEMDRTQFTSPLFLTIDTEGPAGGSPPELLASSDSGMFNDDGITAINQPAFVGTGEPNVMVRILANGSIVGEGFVGPDGAWEITVEPLIDGVYEISAVYLDKAGNSTESESIEVIIDTVGPNLPFVDLDTVSDTGIDNQDDVTRGNLDGNGDPDGMVTLNLTTGQGGIVPGTMPDDPANELKWRLFDLFEGEVLLDDMGLTLEDFFTITTALSPGDGAGMGMFMNDGVHPLKLVSEDRAGNLSHEFLLEITFDTLAPLPAFTPDLLASSDSGMFDFDDVTNIDQPAFAGTNESNAMVRVLANGQVVGEGLVISNNTWEVTIEPLDDGIYDITAEYEDLAGNIAMSDPEEPLVIEIDTVEPNTPFLDLQPQSDSGRSNEDNITNDTMPFLDSVIFDPDGPDTSAMFPNGHLFEDIVKYRIFDRFDTTPEATLVDVNVFQQNGAFADMVNLTGEGLHNLKLEVEDRAGNLSHDFLLEILLDTIAPAPPTISLDSVSDSGVPDQPALFVDNITNITGPKFVGTAEADSIVRHYADGEPISELAIDDSDVFNGLTVAVPLDGNQAFPDGQYMLMSLNDLNDPDLFPLDGTRQMSATAEDVAGNEGDPGFLDIFIDTRGPRVSDVFVTEDPDYDLFDPKPSTDGPTPLINQLTVKFIDFPTRTEDFSYPAVNELLATTIGNYELIGDHVGHILIQEVLFEDFPMMDNGENGEEVAAAAAVGGSGAVIIDGGDRDDHGSVLPGLDGMLGTPDDENQDGWKFIEQMVEFAFNGALNGAADDILVIGASSTALEAIESAANVLGLTTTVVTGAGIAAVDFNDYRVTYVPSDSNTPGGVSDADLDALAMRKADVQNYVNSGGSVVALTEESATAPYAWLELPDPFEIADVSSDTQYQTQALIDAGLVITDGELINGTPLHNIFTGPDGFNGLVPFVYNVGLNGIAEDGGGDDEIVTLGLAPGSLGIGLQPRMTEVTLVFAEPLPDDRFTLRVRDSISDDADNALDGESQASSPFEEGTQQSTVLPSGDGVPGGDFLARFTVDTRAEIGTYAFESVFVDTNGNFVFDPEGQDNDQTNRDLTYQFGFTTDARFAGNFAGLQGLEPFADGFDKLGAYGFSGGSWRWLLDTDNDGVPNVFQNNTLQIQGFPFAGNFTDAHPGDEVGLFTGTAWYFDIDGDFRISNADINGSGIVLDNNLVPHVFPGFISGGNMRGFPIIGDFDGDGTDDLGTWNDNQFFFDLTSNGLNGNTDPGQTISFGFPGVRDRPVAADMDADGIDDVGLWVPDNSGQIPVGASEWYFLISNDFVEDEIEPLRITGTVNTLNHPFSPKPLGNDLFAQFGDDFAIPIVGNFDPPPSGGGSGVDPMSNVDMNLGLLNDVKLTGENLSTSTWYGFEAMQDVPLTVEAQYARGAGDLQIFIYNEAGEMIGGGDSTGTGHAASAPAIDGEQYFVHVVGSNPDVDLHFANNDGPLVTVRGSGSAVPGQMISLDLSVVDPDNIDQASGHTLLIDWESDGIVDETVSRVTTAVVDHTFSAFGTYAVSVTGVDVHGTAGPTQVHRVDVISGTVAKDSNNPLEMNLVVATTGEEDRIGFFQDGDTIQVVRMTLEGGIAWELDSFSGINGRIIVYGGGGDDLLWGAPLVDIPVEFFGEAGNDILVGGAADDLLDGGPGDDLISAGGGNDTLSGHAGRDLLIGGLGADLLDGGDDDDLLISAGTVFDDDLDALVAIHNEWRSPRSYDQRVANISGSGSGPRLNSSFFLQAGATALDDAAVDRLYGRGSLDWFLHDLFEDLILDEEDDEEKTDIGS